MPHWLNRKMIELPYYYRLCLTEKDFKKELKRLKVKDSCSFMGSKYAGATCHYFENDGENLVIVCIGDWKGRDLLEVYGLLVHEAVHIWQGACEILGEHLPSKEMEAYSIQGISQELINSFNKQMKIKSVKI
jgi:hypothetical protein